MRSNVSFVETMIAPWLLDILYRERNWRAGLRRIAAELAGLRDERGRAIVDVARALEHVEPDRRFAVASYQQAGPEAGGGRALDLAIEIGWWLAVTSLAMQVRTATGAIEALVWEGRAWLDHGDRAKADRLIPVTPNDARLVALRIELAGGSEAALHEWQERGRTLTGPAAAEAYLVAARLARVLGRAEWAQWLELAVQAEPGHAGAVSMLIDQRFGDGERGSHALLELLRHRLAKFDERGDLASWCAAVRDAAMRLWLSGDRHRGLARRLLTTALERAYRDGLTEISGHLAMWAALDEAATGDHSRTELLPLLVSALELALPVHDRVWLAALGADICAAESNLAAAHAYAAVVAEHAPLHPAVRAWFAGAIAAPVHTVGELEAFREALASLELEACHELQIEELAPLDDLDDLGLAGGGATSSERGRPRSAPVAPVAPVAEPRAPAPAGVNKELDDALTGALAVIDDSLAAIVDLSEPGSLPQEVVAEPTGKYSLPEVTAERWSLPIAEAPQVPILAGQSGAYSLPHAIVAEPTGKSSLPEEVMAERAERWSLPIAEPSAVPRAPIPQVVVAEPTGKYSLPDEDLVRPASARADEDPASVAALWSPATWARAASSDEVDSWSGGVVEAEAHEPPEAPSAALLTAPGRAASLDGPAGAAAQRRRETVRGPTPEQLRPPRSSAIDRPALPPVAARPAEAAAPGAVVVAADDRPQGGAVQLIPVMARSALAAGGRPRSIPRPPDPAQALPRAPRVTVPMDLRLFIAGREILMQSRDISATGMFAVTKQELPVGETLDGELRVPGAGMLEQTYRVTVRVIRRGALGYGFELVEPTASLVAALAALAASASPSRDR